MSSAPNPDQPWIDGDPPRLLGGQHRRTGRIVFPCPPDPEHEPVALKHRGRLWSYTIQRFRPKSPPYEGPEAFEPFAVGYVELPDEVIVESRLANVDFDQLHVGMEMELAILPFTEGRQVFVFRPVGEPA